MGRGQGRWGESREVEERPGKVRRGQDRWGEARKGGERPGKTGTGQGRWERWYWV